MVGFIEPREHQTKSENKTETETTTTTTKKEEKWIGVRVESVFSLIFLAWLLVRWHVLAQKRYTQTTRNGGDGNTIHTHDRMYVCVSEFECVSFVHS